MNQIDPNASSSQKKTSLTSVFARAAVGLGGIGLAFATIWPVLHSGHDPVNAGIELAASMGAGIYLFMSVLGPDKGSLKECFTNVRGQAQSLAMGGLVAGMGFLVGYNNITAENKFAQDFQSARPIQQDEKVAVGKIFCQHVSKGEKQMITLDGERRALICN